jgi:hypothetical protein
MSEHDAHSFRELSNPTRVVCQVWRDSGCDIEKGEYGTELIIMSKPLSLDEGAGVSLVREAIADWATNERVPEEHIVTLYLLESGEWEDRFWHGYYAVVESSAVSFAEMDTEQVKP